MATANDENIFDSLIENGVATPGRKLSSCKLNAEFTVFGPKWPNMEFFSQAPNSQKIFFVFVLAEALKIYAVFTSLVPFKETFALNSVHKSSPS